MNYFRSIKIIRVDKPRQAADSVPCMNFLYGKKHHEEQGRNKKGTRKEREGREEKTVRKFWRVARFYVERETVYIHTPQARIKLHFPPRTRERATLDPGNKTTGDGRRSGCTRNTENK